ncbi:MAG: Asp-tRNA(Asn)/Glu-tRNA(Gln) amidotransferase subunit GatB [Firmicutes bacterium]|nr:Asp-tRNA(Asn)/Glu-tRNA(Gln) amidotransferase subunit GatB [Bacillota bacterium]
MPAETAREFEIVIGLEIHAELATESKVFCGCATAFGAAPNTLVCPVCLGLPGSLPVVNRRAVEYAVKAGLALNCEIAPFSKFDRKNYFYPDLPKAYQISQYDLPLGRDGWVEFEAGDEIKRVGIARVHLEEEAGKSVHSGERLLGSEYSLIDYNRGGIPLIEIVTKPDLRSPLDARLFLEQLRAILHYIGVSDVKMEEGSLRCDANISLRPAGSDELGAKTEVKNLNSFRSLERALAYEAERQREMLLRGEPVGGDTRHWDETRGVTVAMRTKEEAHDYRYFPDPDLVPVVVDAAWVDRLRKELPELPRARRDRFVAQYGLPRYDAEVLTGSKELADFFEACAARYGKPKAVSNWIMGEFLRLLKAEGKEVKDVSLSPAAVAKLLELIDQGVLSGSAAKEVFEEMFRTGREPQDIVRERGLEQISDEQALLPVVDAVIEANPKAVETVRGGEMKAIGFLVGQVMKQTRGKANPKLVQNLLRQRLLEG